NHWSADAEAKAFSLIGNYRRVGHDAIVIAFVKGCSRSAISGRGRRTFSKLRVVGFPRVGAKDVGRPIKPIAGTMPLLGTALGDHLDLRANRTIEVGRLSEGVDSEFFDAFNRSRNHARSHTVRLGSSGARNIHRITDLVARHIV